MGKNDRDEVARRELKHALEALGDGSGHEWWGPGIILDKLGGRSVLAEQAFAFASSNAWSLLCALKVDFRHRPAPGDVIAVTRKLAPMFLEILLEEETREEARASLFAKVL